MDPARGSPWVVRLATLSKCRCIYKVRGRCDGWEDEKKMLRDIKMFSVRVITTSHATNFVHCQYISQCASPHSIHSWRSGPWSTVWPWSGPWESWRRSLLGWACGDCSAGRPHPTLRSAGCRRHPLELSQWAPRSRSAAHGLQVPDEKKTAAQTIMDFVNRDHSAVLTRVWPALAMQN